MDWRASVRKAENGVIVTEYHEDEETGKPYKRETVFAEKERFGEEARLSELEAFRDALEHISEYLGVYNSKHDKYRLRITVTKHNFETGEETPVEDAE